MNVRVKMPDAVFYSAHAPLGLVYKSFRFLFLVLILTLTVRAYFLESFTVTSGSMAPILLGVHRKCDCPKCGFPVIVGVPPSDVDPVLHWQVKCPNCGHDKLGLENQPDLPGQWLLVDKNVYEWRAPRRWELIVFRGPTGMPYVKRVVGLPGDTVQIKDGDVHINGELAVRPASVCRLMSYVLYDSRHDAGTRWHLDGSVVNEKGELHFNSAIKQRAAATFAMEEPSDWNVYNGARVNRIEKVNDFRLRFQVTATAGTPTMWMECGHDGSEFALSNQKLEVDQLSYDRSKPEIERSTAMEAMTSNLKEVAAFRLSGPLKIPFILGIRGGSASISNVMVYRDTHYQSVGRHAIKTAIRLGPDEFFVLGDNSAVSDDSRMWPEPAVKRSAILGRPLR